MKFLVWTRVGEARDRGNPERRRTIPKCGRGGARNCGWSCAIGSRTRVGVTYNPVSRGGANTRGPARASGMREWRNW